MRIKIKDKDGIKLKTSNTYCADDIELIVEDENLKTENLRAGSSVLSIEGSATSDAVASPTTIKKGKVLYVKGQKIMGEMPTYNNEVEGTIFTIGSDGLGFLYSSAETLPGGYYTLTAYRADIQKAKLPNLKAVSSSLFDNCTKLEQIEVPEVVSISSYGFENCGSLQEIKLPKIETIDAHHAFYNCSSLKAINLGSSFKSLKLPSSTLINYNSNFEGCSSLSRVYYDGDLASWFSTYNNDTFFKNYSGNERSNIYFLDAEGDTEYNNNYYISYNTLAIPNNITEITDNSGTFGYCSGLESIHLHASVEAFVGKPFYGCQNLASITVDSANTKLDSRNNCNAVIETATNKLLLGCKSTLFPNTLTGIGSYALAGCKDITTVNLPNTITGIEESAFEECASLVSVTLPINGFNFLGAKAFKNCKNLTNIQLPSSLNSLGESAFEGCEKLESISVPANITTLATAVFKNCKKLQTLAVPENITKIDSDALGWCSGLTSISISANVTEIASDAIRYCPALETLTVSASNTKYDSRNNCNAIIETATNALVVGCKNTVIPSTVTSIKSGAFYGCTSLTDLVIPNTVTSISGSAFTGCTNLKYTTYNSSKYLGNAANAYMFLADCMSSEPSPVIHSDTKTIGDNAFSGLNRLNSVNIPASVVEIGSSVFSGSSLGNIAMPNSVVTIGTSVFSGCSSLLDIIFSDALTTIPQNTCRSCDRLINVKLPASLTTIEKDAFLYCHDLETIDIPASVTKICDGAFASTGLKTVILRNSSKVCELEMIKTENFVETRPFPHNNIKFYVPDNLVAAYQSAPIWTTYYKNYIKPLSELEE